MSHSPALKQRDYQQLLENTRQCLEDKSEKSITQAMSTLQNLVGFEYAVISQFDQKQNIRRILKVVNHSYDLQWVDAYVSEQYIQIDPVIEQGIKTVGPFEWSTNKKIKPKRPQQFFNAARDFGLKTGVANVFTSKQKAPLSHDYYTVISMANVEEPRVELSKYLLQLMSPVLSESVSKCTTRQPVCLSKREIEILKWMMAGKSAWETSIILSISERTVRFHLANVYKKLDVVNCPHAIGEAIKLGLV
ncbi:MAG: LuxR C-terminal-related transcriptional regulator [Gammaproteobacteria bacterium]|nr:LuxR C-terminal-related transcriptional regulator [Gammaproteobacteria bacterium]MDH5802272.1 LuxR C-terminal-related transcriptional regulator [Gammaproteobacteria bacterium]